MTTVTKKCLAHLPVVQSLCLDPVENPTFQGFHLRYRNPILSEKWASIGPNQWPLPGEIVHFSANWIKVSVSEVVPSLCLHSVCTMWRFSIVRAFIWGIVARFLARNEPIHCPFFWSKSWFFNPYGNGISLISGWITLFRLCGKSQLPELSFEA